MKKQLLNTLLLVVASILSSLTTTAQIMPPVQNAVYLYPNNPTSKDSINIVYVYVSGDSCPDFILVQDSVIANKIYVHKRSIESPGICSQVVTKFAATLNLGLLPENTQVYFEGNLINTIHHACNMDREGIVVEGTGGCSGQLFINETTIYLSAIPRLFALQKTVGINTDSLTPTGLKPGDKVKFGGYEIMNDSNATTTCRIVGIATCYEVNTTPPTGCVMDKKGLVVVGKNACAGKLFIQEYSPINSYPQLYSIAALDSLNSTGTYSISLKEGDVVKFGGYPVKNDSSVIDLCRIVGIATCYEVESTPPACIMDKMGTVIDIKDDSSILKEDSTSYTYALKATKLSIGTRVKFKGVLIECFTTPCYNQVECYNVISTPACLMDKVGVVVPGIDGCTGQLFIQDTSSTSIQLYAFENSVTANGTNPGLLKVGDKVKFGGTLIKNDSTASVLCSVVGKATCYEVISTPACVMDKVGVVVPGIDGCTGQLFIQDTSSTSIQLYAFENSVTANGPTPVMLKVGDKVKFGGTLIKNDSTASVLCSVVGKATCYEVISTPACLMDKVGVVVPGIDGCTGQLFIQDTSSMSIQLYAFENSVTANGANPGLLKVGDKVKFGGILIKNDSTASVLCSVVGKATCYELLSSENRYTLAGLVFAGNELMTSGLAILYKKGDIKATASYLIADSSTFRFTNLPTAEYTVYVIPTISMYKNYLPTFYVNNFLYESADYLTLNNNLANVTVNLKHIEFSTGTGKISGNIFFETYYLKDSIMVNNGTINTGRVAINNSAINTPVILLNTTGIPAAWTMTDSNGNYTFENIALDTYTIVVQTASAIGESMVKLTTGNSIANADLMLKSPQSNTGIPNARDIVLEIYPNSTTGNLIITLKENGIVELYNCMGQLMMHQILYTGLNVLDISAVNKGVYLAKIGGTTMKIIKK